MTAGPHWTAKTWLEAWTERLNGVSGWADVRAAHEWLWGTWVDDEANRAVAEELNGALHLEGDDELQVDPPHWVSGNLDGASPPQVLFVNTSPGWDAARYERERDIVGQSESAAWDFARELYVRPEAERTDWWRQTIGLAWRIVHGTASNEPQETRKWALGNVAGCELFPIHSRRGGFLTRVHPLRLGASPIILALHHSIRAALNVALRLDARVVLVGSSIGADFALKNSVVRTWTRKTLDWSTWRGEQHAVPMNIANLHGTTFVALPRPVIGSRPEIPLDLIARQIRKAAGLVEEQA